MSNNRYESVLINSNEERLVISATIQTGGENGTHRVLESAIEYRLSNTSAPDIRVMRGAPTKMQRLLPPAKIQSLGALRI